MLRITLHSLCIISFDFLFLLACLIILIGVCCILHSRSIAKFCAMESAFFTFSFDTPWPDEANFEISPFFLYCIYIDSLLAGRPCRGRQLVYQHKPYCNRQIGSGIVALSQAITMKRGRLRRESHLLPTSLFSVTCFESLSSSAGMPIKGN